jgi:hypothetical protein
MNRTSIRLSWILMCAGAALSASCESTTQVGSGCKNGVCPRESSISSRACVVSSTYMEVAIARPDNADPDGALQALCLPRALGTNSSGLIDCRVTWLLNTGTHAPEEAAPSPERCSDLPFLEPAGAGEPDNACVMQQVSAAASAEGAEGWYYDDEIGDLCADGRPGVHVTAGALPWSRVTVQVECALIQAVDDQGKLVDVAASECGEVTDASAENVGAACMPDGIPEGGFDPREAWVQTFSDDCDLGTCLTLGLHGDPTATDCEHGEDIGCPSDEEIERTQYCSCRCDAPAGDPGELCECPEDYSCVPVIADGPAGVRGSYCVRDDSLSDR